MKKTYCHSSQYVLQNSIPGEGALQAQERYFSKTSLDSDELSEIPRGIYQPSVIFIYLLIHGVLEHLVSPFGLNRPFTTSVSNVKEWGFGLALSHLDIDDQFIDISDDLDPEFTGPAVIIPGNSGGPREMTSSPTSSPLSTFSWTLVCGQVARGRVSLYHYSSGSWAPVHPEAVSQGKTIIHSSSG